MQNQPNNAVSIAISQIASLLRKAPLPQKKREKSPGELSLSKGFPGVRCYDMVTSYVVPIAI